MHECDVQEESVFLGDFQSVHSCVFREHYPQSFAQPGLMNLTAKASQNVRKRASVTENNFIVNTYSFNTLYNRKCLNNVDSKPMN